MIGEGLKRFIEAQHSVYQTAFEEISKGKKQSHWMWFIFPQIEGLGFSAMSKRYSIKDIREAETYLENPVLGQRLLAVSRQLLKSDTLDATRIFSTPDDLKLRSSMTLFSCVPGADPVFQQVLHRFFEGLKDPLTLALLK